MKNLILTNEIPLAKDYLTIVSNDKGEVFTRIPDEGFTIYTYRYYDDIEREYIEKTVKLRLKGEISGTPYSHNDIFPNNTTSLHIGNAITSIDYYAFYQLQDISEVTIAEGPTLIGNYSFSSCTQLEEIIIPKSVQSIGHGAFSYCEGLTTVTLLSDTMCSGRYNSFDGCSNLEKIYVPSSLVNTYKADPEWSYYANKIYPITQS